MERFDIINNLIKKYNYSTYLEIGTQHGNCFEKVEIKNKICVDPVKVYEKLTHEMTSDEFFDQNKNTYDIIFVDGLHTEEQTHKDILNSLKILNEHGSIVVHDCLPHAEEFIQICWNGTVFRSIIDLRYNQKDVTIKVVDTDNGCGIIQRGKQELYNKVPLEEAKTYAYYSNNKAELMNVVSVSEFLTSLVSY